MKHQKKEIYLLWQVIKKQPTTAHDILVTIYGAVSFKLLLQND